MNNIAIIAIVVIAVIVIGFLLSKRSEAVEPRQGEAKTEKKTEKETRFEPWSDKYEGVEYTAECLGDYDGEPFITVSIKVDKPLKQSFEVNARGKAPVIPPEPVAQYVRELLQMGVNYIDINYNTDWIAAEVPEGRATVDRELAERIVRLLVGIRNVAG
ncbi:MAG: hypothetical protein WA162_05740 [Thermodesulfobacteriota bacterium]